MYHYVREIANSPHPNIKGLEVSAFKNQLNFLNKNYTIIKANELAHSLNTGDSLPDNPCLLSFDDGYSDHYNYVLPILSEHNLTGAFYPSAITSKEHVVLDVNKIHYLMDHITDIHTLIKATTEILDELRKSFNDIETTESLYRRYAKANRFDNKDVIFFKRLLQLGLAEHHRKYILDKLLSLFMPISETELSKVLYMSESQLKEMVQCGMHIGSHCYDHYWLDSLSKKQQEHQIEQSLDFLENIGAKGSWSIAYPSGSYNSDTIDLLRAYGCQFGLTTKPEHFFMNPKFRFEISRLDTNDFPK
jgi:peptidoglycan/xylan/chitin deacetylase (PgdA/CDA1 family)